MAELITNGNLLEKVSETEARNLMLSGRIIQAKDSGSLLGYDITESFGNLPNPRYIFYRQGMMFVAWLKQRNEAKFKVFLLSIQDGLAFREAFDQAFDGGVESLQTEFVHSFNPP
ncbi:MAG: hypothetical protein ABL925_13010 [Methylococcales bacterium]